MSEFYNQGAVPLSSRAYIPRSFEGKVFGEIAAERWVLLLGPRQHGKSSALVRLNQKFREAGFIVIMVDLQGLPPCSEFRDLLRWFFMQAGKSLGRTLPFPEDDQQGDMASWLEVGFSDSSLPVVVIIDEAGSIENTEYRNVFYGQIRQISSLRAYAAEGAIAGRVRFVFAGTFRPESLVDERNSPFNVCQTIHTDDVSLEQARALAAAVHPEMEKFVEEAHLILNGQPFLLQTVFQEVIRRGDIEAAVAFSEALHDMPNLVAQHLEGIFSKVIGNPGLTEKVAIMVKQGYTDLIPANSDCSFLQVLGLAKRNEARLVFRSSFYADVAKASVQIVLDPQQITVHDTVYGIQKSDLAFMKNSALREVCFSSYEGATKAHRNGSFRLALTGFGSAMEALLLDLLTSIGATPLQSAVATANKQPDRNKHANFNTRFETPTDPLTWRLVNLINVAKQVKKGTKSPEPSHALREWRNLVHPAEAIKHFVDESRLKPESLAASALFAILLRDIS